MRRSGIVFSLALVVLLTGRTEATFQQSSTQSSPARQTVTDVSKLGPQVGQRVPDFSLQDQSGKTWTLQSIMGPRGAMLVFYRSADW
jgi:hypothetical protein